MHVRNAWFYMIMQANNLVLFHKYDVEDLVKYKLIYPVDRTDLTNPPWISYYLSKNLISFC